MAISKVIIVLMLSLSISSKQIGHYTKSQSVRSVSALPRSNLKEKNLNMIT